MERIRFDRVGLADEEDSQMFQRVATALLIGAALAAAACNTVRGAARDVNSVANCTENTINGRTCP